MNDSLFYCDLTALSADQRAEYQTLLPKLVKMSLGVDEDANAFTVHFTKNEANLRSAAQFMFFEGQCCPFIEFELRVSGKEKHASLKLSGPEGSKDFLRAELHPLMLIDL